MRHTPIRRLRSSDLWAVALPVTLTAMILAHVIGWLLALDFGILPDFNDFLSVFPIADLTKANQQFRYYFMIIAWPLLGIGGIYAYHGWKNRRSYAERVQLSRTMITAAQICAALFALWNIIYQEAFVYAFFATKSTSVFLSILVFLAAAYFAYRVLLNRGSVEPNRYLSVGLLGLAAVISAAHLLACIIGEGNYSTAVQGVAAQLPYTFDEFAAVANGRTLSVDYFPQYQQLLPYLFIPWFKIFGMNLMSYTVGVALISAGILAFVYGILKRVTDRPSTAALLFLAWLGVAFFPLDILGDSRYTAFTYFPVGPFRYISFWSVAYLTLRTVTGNFSFRNQILCFFWAVFIAFNTFDFGIPALIACLIISFLFSSDWRTTLKAWGAGLGLGVGLYLLFPLIRTGQLPDLPAVLAYSRAVGRAGYSSLPTPAWGLHWIFILALLVSLATGLMRWWNNRIRTETSKRERSLTAAFLFFGIAGPGVFTYFMYRSHWHVLIVLAPIAAFPFLLAAASYFRRGRAKFAAGLHLIPRISCFIVVAASLALLINTPNPVAQIKRIASQDKDFLQRQAVYTQWIRRNAQSGEKVGISFPFGQLFANRADVVNVFPYPQAGSMLLRSQLQIAIETLEKNGVETLFGDLPAEFGPWMISKRFREIERIGQFAVYQMVPEEIKIVPAAPLNQKKSSSAPPR